MVRSDNWPDFCSSIIWKLNSPPKSKSFCLVSFEKASGYQISRDSKETSLLMYPVTFALVLAESVRLNELEEVFNLQCAD